jgi:very-short-patch-repair endonuclease
MTRKTTLTDQDRQEIAHRYAAGAGIVELARTYRCRTEQINLIVRAPGMPVRKALTASTPIECRLHDALMAAGIGFSTQKRLVGRYVVDIKVHQAPVVIEADGFRHRIGTQAQERDAARDAAHEAAGYRVFRFTGSEINTDAVKCIQTVINACGLAPDEEPVYDIRTKFSGTDHPRWVGGYELTCDYCGETFTARRRRKYCTHEHFILGAVKGKPKSPEHGAKIAAANRGRKQTPEARAKISAARKGKPGTSRPKSPEQRAKIGASLKGRKESDETREKKRAAHLGKKRDPAIGAKISEALKGKPKSAKHRANISASMRGQIKIESDLT